MQVYRQLPRTTRQRAEQFARVFAPLPKAYSTPMAALRFLWLALFLVMAPVVARAELGASDWVREDQAQLRLIAAQTGTGAGGELRLGLQMRLAPGWKTYWRTPGDAGLPLHIDWAGSTNLESAELRWPVPQRYTLLGLDTFGYGDEVVFPIALKPARTGEAVSLSAVVDYLVCERICIPYTAKLALYIPAGPAAPSAFVQAIDRFWVRVPGDGAAHGLRLEQAEWRAGSAPTLAVTVAAREPLVAPDLFVEAPPGWSFGRPSVSLSVGGTRAVLRLPARSDLRDGGANLTGQRVRLTLVDGERSAEQALTLAAGTPEQVDWAALVAILGVALIGGAILNLMPCVLPVLALKLFGFVGLGQAGRHAARVNLLATAAGIVVAFVGLAAALVAINAAGYAVGWGIQFQSPTFLVLMVLVLALFAANLWGWFEFRLPAAIAGAVPEAREGPTGAFLTGVFATLLATPCSAPFVGTAVGFALSRGAVEVFAVFAALGVGLAAPYLTVAMFPGLARLLPRPGAWMGMLRVVLGLALIATAVWLLWVLASEAGWMAAALVAALALTGLVILRFGPAIVAARPRWAALATIALVAFIVPLRFGAPPDGAFALEAPAGEIEWRPFDLASVRERVYDNQVVLVDVTAEWCLTCRINKALVLTRGEVGRELAEGRVIAVRADWTRPDERISAYLASFGRYGIPFNVVYGPGAPDGIALPELLTSGAVLDAFQRARGAPAKAALR
jgi:suppressor for copper-sensitivity B